MVASTPKRENANQYTRIKQIRFSGKVHELCAYEAAPHSACKGVIHDMPLRDYQATIDGKTVNQNNPFALEAKRNAKTATVIIAFDGNRVPNFVRLGHRAYVSPTPSNVACRDAACQSPISSLNTPRNARSVAARILPRVKNVRIDLSRRTSFTDDASSVPNSKSSSPRRRSFDPAICKPHTAPALGAEDAHAREADPQADGAPEVTLPRDPDVVFSSALQLMRPLQVPHRERLVQVRGNERQASNSQDLHDPRLTNELEELRRANDSLRKENAQFKQEISRLAAEMAEIRRLARAPRAPQPAACASAMDRV
ncbi:hypothetical protein HPB49_017446 [Dermacentor silvarum]|uniref:Uncharacterized protein n=1 Tax=Dermacentor silvarum TaxID=543639 RepID=A0ACB8CGG4_DERSI|nr:hypothetical protein HPB49_017446 [Dermacentor silvarum]